LGGLNSGETSPANTKDSALELARSVYSDLLKKWLI
jgi:hypothetical protein